MTVKYISVVETNLQQLRFLFENSNKKTEDELFAEEPAGTESNSKRNDIQEDSEKIKAAKVKIKPLCETRWLERHTAFKDFEDLYKSLLLCLDTISPNKGCKNWDANSKTVAQGLFHQITKPAFIAGFCSAKYLFGYTVGLSRHLQGSTLTVVDAYNDINDIRNAKSEFAGPIKDIMRTMAKKALVCVWQTDIAQ